MKKILFIDRDGTLIVEPKTDQQVDSLEKLEFLPGVFRNLYRIATELDFELVIATNQDGLGTDSFAEETFWPAHEKMLRAFENEGVSFADILVDRSFERDNVPTRKPGVGMFSKYIFGNYDLANSFVIGDRETDVQLARNLGCKAILLGDVKTELACQKATNWHEIFACLKNEGRRASISRKTSETEISIELNLDGSGKSSIKTGIGFFDHMLEQIARHGGIDLEINVNGDLHIDEHHTVEDTALALGSAFAKALGSKKGISRYGFLLPMDDCLAQVAVDFGGRPWLVWEADFRREKVGELPTELFFHFFKSFSDAAACNLNIKAEGENEHHKIEAIFKGFARAVKMAVKTGEFSGIPSTKGIL
ncbi:MAG: bifunctional histidinol-phosphatase/imidazoleglycerol-phosphate dehydratase HisB [Flavobacterium sp.]|uniref:bifunctional histidinol-phosphatase/imidazoleglycerol-phosphate dehydratase HisB n=1 Tax=Flavobacterium sp. TaxID=239 RepID=UPI001205E424|nr:bifunctional histidinol-phosphatase/imidazoleglycerol-phosphate dehydratase HisB [Flavobacterium sp.]RZJ66236.1 MAG: bifunctional histidinol-phosphatase/imidazoleglycerol-phosphate dehydratase HisB [Flavobacterium sp.]